MAGGNGAVILGEWGIRNWRSSDEHSSILPDFPTNSCALLSYLISGSESSSGLGLGTTIEFVNFHGPPGKGTAASGAKIRAHAMRQVHHQRRITKASRPTNTTGAQPHVHICNKFHADPGRNRNSQPGSPGSRASKARDYQERLDVARYAGPPKLPSRNTVIEDTGFSVIYVECGKMQVLSWLATEGNLCLDLKFARPRDVDGARVFDPFNSTAEPITHRMHELIHHCRALTQRFGAIR